MKATPPIWRTWRVAVGVAWALVGATAGADLIAVVAEPSRQTALDEWATLRRRQGHRLITLAPEEFPGRLVGWRDSLRAGERSVLLFVGDGRLSGVAPASVPANVIRRYGPEEDIASDAPLGSMVGADVVARIPINEPATLRAYFKRVVRRETSAATWSDLRLQLAAGVGGFSPFVDAAIEQAAANLLNRLAPTEATISLRRYGLRPNADDEPMASAPLRGGLWVWMGHGWRDQLPGVANDSLVGVCGGADVAVLLACYAGDFTTPGRCVAEQLLTDDDGPLVVVAATRVTMPYGNTRLGAEMLLGLRDGRRDPVGLLLASAKNRSHGESTASELRGLEQLAALVGADQDLLPAERREHCLAYNLLGDPLLEVNRVAPMSIGAPSRLGADEPLVVTGVAPFAGKLRVDLAKTPSRQGEATRIVERFVEAGESYSVTALAPEDWKSGSRRVRVGVEGREGLAVGLASVSRVREGTRVAAGQEESATR